MTHSSSPWSKRAFSGLREKKMRDVTEEQKELTARGLKAVGPYGVAVLYPRGNSEAYRYADQLAFAIREAAWHVRGPQPQDWTIAPVGVAVHVADYANPGSGALALLHILNAANISDRTDFARATPAEPDSLHLIVGKE
jgi:hypothetical protein